jgi:hypothetical protein
MKKIVVIGEVLVEIIADIPGEGFKEPLNLTGPYPSGAPAIFADQAARIGQPCALVSTVGADDFGTLNLDRLKRDGVDISAIGTDPSRPTGSAFVRYRTDGSRDFIFNITHSACGRLEPTEAAGRVLDSADHLHIMGSSLSSRDFLEQNIKVAEAIKQRGGTVSFDPNLRKEMLASPDVVSAMHRVLALTDLYLPSGDELTLLTDAADQADAVEELLTLGVCAIAHKLGAVGARYYDVAGTVFAPSLQVEEIDPTGAGDCFGAAFTSLWLRGVDPGEALMLANAAGALAVGCRGPMEGVSSMEKLQEFVCNQRKAS